MPISYNRGDIFESQAEVLVNPVNCVGVMGKGLALQFKERFPENFNAYKRVCDGKGLQPGNILVCDISNSKSPRAIVNFPTKNHWRDKSRLVDVVTGLRNLARYLCDDNVKSVAIPAIGCGLGGLDWDDVRPIIERELGYLETNVFVYVPF